MKRRLVRQGHNTLTVSLPREWCDTNKVKEGDEVDLTESLNCVVISKEAFRGKDEVKIDVSDLDRSTIILLIQSLYTYGHNLITITSKSNKVKYHLRDKELLLSSVINDSVNRLVGAEIISSSNDTYQIQVLADESREKFDVILRRIFLLASEMFELFVNGLKSRDRSLIEAIAIKHINVKKFVNYALRILNKFGHEQANKTNFYFSIVNYLGKISEIVKNTAGYNLIEGTMNLSPACISLINDIRTSFDFFTKAFYKYELKQITEFIKSRDLLKRKIYAEKKKNLTKDDIFVIGSVSQCIDIVIDIAELRMAIEY